MAHKSLTKAIAKELQKGMICYINKQSLKITTITDLEVGMENPPEREAQLKKLEKNIRMYYKVPRMSSQEEGHVRQDFIKEGVNTSIKKELINALKRENPVRNYMRIINNDEFLEHCWLTFKADWYQQWVRGYLLDIYRF